MTVHVVYSGQARAAAAGRASEKFDVPDANCLHDLLTAIAGRHGEAMGRLVAAGAGERPPVLVFVNDEQVDWRSPVRLKDGDHVALVSPISGG